MKSAINCNRDELRILWAETPWWFIYLSTIPSMLIWLAIIIKPAEPVLAMLMILTIGIPTKLLHHIFASLCVKKCKKPTGSLHAALFLVQCVVYFVLFNLIIKS